jgi:hypothetical protein
MRSDSTAEYMAAVAFGQHFGRPGTPTDQAEIETLFGHIKREYPHLTQIEDPATLRAELKIVREHYNTVRLHESLGYVAPDDEHEGRGPGIREARSEGLKHAHCKRVATRRRMRQTETHPSHLCRLEETWICRIKSDTPHSGNMFRRRSPACQRGLRPSTNSKSTFAGRDSDSHQCHLQVQFWPR